MGIKNFYSGDKLNLSRKNIKLLSVFMMFIIVFMSFVSAQVVDSKIISVSLVNQDPDPAIAGDVVEFRVGVENLGGEAAEDVILEFVEQYPFEKISGEEYIIELGTLNSQQSDKNIKIAKFKVKVDKDTIAGDYELKIKTYEEDSSSQITRSLTASVENKEGAEIIYIDQVEIIPGKITPLTFTVNNVGSTPLRDLSFQWENEDDIILPVGSDNTKYIKYIDVDDSYEIKYNVIASANADPDLYKLDLTLTYEDSLTGDEKEIKTKAGVYVGGATDFDAAYSGSSDGEYTFAISNIGSVSATSVTVRVPDQTGWQVTGSNSVIIGNLNEGDYTIASFQLTKTTQNNNLRNSTFKRNMDGSGEMPEVIQNNDDDLIQQNAGNIGNNQDSSIALEIVYTDSRGNRETIEKQVFIDSSAVSSGATTEFAGNQMGMRQKQNTTLSIWNNYKWYIIGLVIVLFFLLVRHKHKKGRITKSKYTYKDALKDTVFFWRK